MSSITPRCSRCAMTADDLRRSADVPSNLACLADVAEPDVQVITDYIGTKLRAMDARMISIEEALDVPYVDQKEVQAALQKESEIHNQLLTELYHELDSLDANVKTSRAATSEVMMLANEVGVPVPRKTRLILSDRNSKIQADKIKLRKAKRRLLQANRCHKAIIRGLMEFAKQLSDLDVTTYVPPTKMSSLGKIAFHAKL